jgi:hypothetical protein
MGRHDIHTSGEEWRKCSGGDSSTVAGDDDEVGGVVGDRDVDGLRCKSDDFLLLESVRLVLRVLMKKMYNGYNHNTSTRKKHLR